MKLASFSMDQVALYAKAQGLRIAFGSSVRRSQVLPGVGQSLLKHCIFRPECRRPPTPNKAPEPTRPLASSIIICGHSASFALVPGFPLGGSSLTLGQEASCSHRSFGPMSVHARRSAHRIHAADELMPWAILLTWILPQIWPWQASAAACFIAALACKARILFRAEQVAGANAADPLGCSLRSVVGCVLIGCAAHLWR